MVDPDPYLVSLVRAGVPDGEVVEVDGRSGVAGPLAEPGDVVVIDADNRRLAQVLLNRDAVRIIAIGKPGDGATDLDVDLVLIRPFDSRDLQAAVGEFLHGGDRARTPRRPLFDRLSGWLGPARVATVALAAVLELVRDQHDAVAVAALVLAFLWSGIRLRLLRERSAGAWLDVLFAFGLLATTGGMDSNYFAFALVVAVGAGLTLGPREGLVAGGLIALAAVPDVATSIARGTGMEPRSLAAWWLLFPVSGLAGGQAQRLWDADGRSRDALVEANRVLTELYRIAQTMPRGLTLDSVASAVLDEAGDAVDAKAALLLVQDAGVLFEAGSSGFPEHGRVLLERDDDAVAQAMSSAGPAPLSGSDVVGRLPAPFETVTHWHAVPLRHAGIATGLLVVGTEASLEGRATRRLHAIATDAALAVRNARLFGRVRDLALDGERMRLATSLHDGVAQAIAHVRLELEFLARDPHVSDRQRTELQRMAHVADRTLADIRGTIGDLRAASGAQGLARALRDYCRDVRALSGADVQFHGRTAVRLPATVEGELFRIARTAIASSLRRAGVSTVDVTFDDLDGEVRLTITDDGRVWDGVDKRAAREAAMGREVAERAASVGASLTVESTDRDGRSIVLTYRSAQEEAGTAAGVGS